MAEWLASPAGTTVIVAIAGGLLWLANWIGKMQEQKSEVAKFVTELRAHTPQILERMQQILERLPRATVTPSSPLRLTEYGKKIAGHLNAKVWAQERARDEELLRQVRGLEEHEIDEFVDLRAGRLLTAQMQASIAPCAYQFGVTRDDVLRILKVVLRDELIERSQLPPPPAVVAEEE